MASTKNAQQTLDLEGKIKELEKELEEARSANEYLQDRICEVENSLEYFEGEGYWEQFNFESKMVKELQNHINWMKEVREMEWKEEIAYTNYAFDVLIRTAENVTGKKVVIKNWAVALEG